MQMMVEEQGEAFDQIESNADNAAVDLEKGANHIDRAIVIAKSTRAVSSYNTCRISLKNINFYFRKNGVVSLSPLFLL